MLHLLLLFLIFSPIKANDENSSLVPIIKKDQQLSQSLLTNKVHVFSEFWINGNITTSSPIQLATMQPGCYNLKYKINTYCPITNDLTYSSLIVLEDKIGINSALSLFGTKDNNTSFIFDEYLKIITPTNIIVRSGTGCDTDVLVTVNNFEYRELDCRDMDKINKPTVKPIQKTVYDDKELFGIYLFLITLNILLLIYNHFFHSI